jgi:hypothetical protein
MTQPNVPWWVATAIVVIGAMVTASLAYQDPAVVIAPLIRFILAIVNIGLITLAAVLNIKRPSP